MGPRLGCLAWASGRLYLIAWHRQQAGDPWPEAATGKAKTGDGTWWPLGLSAKLRGGRSIGLGAFTRISGCRKGRMVRACASG